VNDLLTTDEVAALCRTSPSTVRHWRNKRTGPRAVKLHRHVLYKRADVEDWIQTLYEEDEASRSAPGGRRSR
jgi:predicted DNA-binding transcriptional regulator AlpA